MTKLTIENSEKLADMFGHILASAVRQDGQENGQIQAMAYHTMRNVMYMLAEDNAEFDSIKFAASIFAVKAEVSAK